MLMVNKKIDINTNIIHSLNIDFFKSIYQSSLVDVFLKRMESQLDSLVFTHDWTPEVEDLIHWILFIPGKADGFLENKWMIL